MSWQNVFWIFVAICFFPTMSYAYIDPATGSMAIQAIVAIIAAVGIFIKLMWHRIRAFFGSKKKKDM